MSDVCASIEASSRAAARPGSPDAAQPPALRQPQLRPGMLWAVLDTANTLAPERRFSRNRLPLPFETRLHRLCSGIIDRFADRAQTIRLEIVVDGICPGVLESAIFDIARHSVRDTIQHGMRLRLIGRICVHLLTRGGTTTLTISHDGWDCHVQPCGSDGRCRAERLVQRHAGRITLYRGHMTTMEVELRHGI